MIIFRHPDSNAPASVCPESYSSGIRSNSRKIFYGTRRCGFANRFPCFPKRSSSNRLLPQNSERAQLPMSRYPLRSPTGKDSCPVRLPPGEAGLPPVCPASLPNRLLFLTCPIPFQVFASLHRRAAASLRDTKCSPLPRCKDCRIFHNPRIRNRGRIIRAKKSRTSVRDFLSTNIQTAH